MVNVDRRTQSVARQGRSANKKWVRETIQGKRMKSSHIGSVVNRKRPTDGKVA
jgi:hypothetical protein